MLRILKKDGPSRLRVMAGALVGAGVGLSSLVFLGLPEYMQGWSEACKLVPAMVGFVLAIPGIPVAGRGNLTLAVVVLFWATIGALVFWGSGSAERAAANK